MNYQILTEFFRLAIAKVDRNYYGSDDWSDSMLNGLDIYEGDERRKKIEPCLSRYGERVFCYELYYQIRTLMELWKAENNSQDELPVFQAELRKELINGTVEEIFKVRNLGKKYMPDFLLHSPNDFNHQELVVEVKASPKLTFAGFKDDLVKIQKFISNYNYLQGIFITINTEPVKMLEVLNKQSKWIKKNLSDRDKILFMCKQSKDVPLFECRLNEIPKTLTKEKS